MAARGGLATASGGPLLASSYLPGVLCRTLSFHKGDSHERELFLVEGARLVDVGQFPDMGKVLLGVARREQQRTDIGPADQPVTIGVTSGELGSTAELVHWPLVRGGRQSGGARLNL